MCVEGDDVPDAHGLQLLQSHSAVQTLADDAAVLTAAVQAGHDDRHTVCLTGDRLDQALEVGEVVIGREVILIAEQVVGHTVVPRIDHDEDIVAADGFLDQTLGVTALEAGALAGDDEALFSTPADLAHSTRCLSMRAVSSSAPGHASRRRSATLGS